MAALVVSAASTLAGETRFVPVVGDDLQGAITLQETALGFGIGVCQHFLQLAFSRILFVLFLVVFVISLVIGLVRRA